MKTAKRTISSLLICAAFIFTNCTKDQQFSYQDTTREIITNGKWTVQSFVSGQDLTSNYSNYEFIFLGNGTLSAASANHQLSGTWKMIRDVNYNDVLKINIETGDPSFAEMNDQWTVTDKSSVLVSMSDNSNSQLQIRKL